MTFISINYCIDNGYIFNFEKVIQKAKDAYKNAGVEVEYHFPDVRKTIPMPKGAE